MRIGLVQVGGRCDVMGIQRRRTLPFMLATSGGLESAAAGTVALGTGVTDGDLMIVWIESNTAQPGTISTGGWAQIGPTMDTGDSSLAVWWKIFATGDTAPTVADAGDHMVAYMVTFRGINFPQNPFFSVKTDSVAATTTCTFPSAMIPHGGAGVFAIVGIGRDLNATDNYNDYATSSRCTLRRLSDRTSSIGLGGGAATFWGLCGLPGETGPMSVAANTAGSIAQNHITMVFR